MTDATDDVRAMQAALDAAIARGGTPVDRAVVVPACGSTQDEARRRCEGRAGLVVVAGRQTAGRGRLGRSWADTSHLGLAATIVVPAGDPGTLALAAGVAALRCVQAAGASGVGVRWPNDVVERGGAGRKIAGVLIEAAAGVALVGIGVNVRQREADWPTDLRGRAASLAALGSGVDRPAAAVLLVDALGEALRSGPDQLAAAWRDADTLIGTRQSFDHDGRRYSGLVSGIDPTSEIELRTDRGVVRLPALTTSLVHAPD